ARGEVGTEPLPLRGPRRHRDVGAGGAAAAVEHDDVPVAQVVAVVALAGLPRGSREVVEIAGGIGRVVFVVAGRRLGAGLVPAPVRMIAVCVFRAGPALVYIVANGKHGAGDVVQEIRGQ